MGEIAVGLSSSVRNLTGYGDLLDFVMAIDEYKRINERPFPSWTEVFEIMQYLGYRKVAERAEHINTASGAEVLG